MFGIAVTPRSTSCAAESAAPASKPIRRTLGALVKDHATGAEREWCAPGATLEGKERDDASILGWFPRGDRTGLGMSETNAGTRLHRALTKLRKACNDAS